VYAPLGHLSRERLMLKHRVVLDRLLHQLSELADGQRARRGLMTR